MSNQPIRVVLKSGRAFTILGDIGSFVRAMREALAAMVTWTPMDGADGTVVINWHEVAAIHPEATAVAEVPRG